MIRSTHAPTLAQEDAHEVKLAMVVALPRLIRELRRVERDAARERELHADSDLSGQLLNGYENMGYGLRFALSCLAGSLLIMGEDWRADLEKYAEVEQ